MRRLIMLLALATLLAVGASNVAAATPAELQATAIGRLPFPERGYLISLPRDAAVGSQQVHVVENSVAVGNVSVSPLASSKLRYGVVLALDASDSMAGAPFAAALRSGQSFIAHRGAKEEVGLLVFNGSVHVLRQPTTDGSALAAAFVHPPALAYGTRIYDAIDQSLTLLSGKKVSAGAVVLLSDGADVGSTATLEEVVRKARAQNVRVFTIGLRSPVFDGDALSTVARRTGGSYAEAASTVQLVPIYAELSQRLAGEYVLQYRSVAAPTSPVRVEITVEGFGTTEADYTAPTPSGLAPFHQSLLSRFLLSPGSVVILSLLVAGLLGLVLRLMLDRSRSRVVERVRAFVDGRGAVSHDEPRRRRAPRAVGSHSGAGFMAKLERDLDIACIGKPARQIVGITVVATAAIAVGLALVAPVLALLSALVPFVPRAMISHKVRQVRNEFAEQLPPNLQVLASGLRAGHSFIGAFSSAVEHAHEPSRRELGRAIADEKLGMPIDQAIRRVSDRMASRDLEQVALLAELQRTTGGNAAEVLDIVVATVRERGDVRRLVTTLTAQGRMSRWILTALPIVTGVAFYAIQPQIMGPMVHSGVGQAVFVVAGMMVAAGSLVIQRIVDIEV